MSPNFQIAWRFLVAKKRALFMSLAGIVFGVAFFIVTQAQTAGFQNFFVQTILGVNGALRVQDQYQYTLTDMVAELEDSDEVDRIRLREGREYRPGVHNPNQVAEAVRAFDEVTGVAAVLRGSSSISSGFRSDEGRVLGINLLEYLAVSDLGLYLRHGDLADFSADPAGILLGNRLAARLQVSVGDTVYLGHLGEQRRYRIAAIYETGVEQYDRFHYFIHLAEARLLLKRPDEITYLQVAVRNPDNAPVLAQRIEEAVGHHVASWQERERSWLDVFRVLTISSAITMSAIILIAGLGIFNTLAIIVMERSREIAILRSMGYSRGDIRSIFIYQGMVVMVLGTLIGFVLALCLTWGVERLPIRIRGIFATDSFLVEWSVWHYVWAAVIAAVVVFIASWIPARKAARMEPASIIRGTGA